MSVPNLTELNNSCTFSKDLNLRLWKSLVHKSRSFWRKIL